MSCAKLFIMSAILETGTFNIVIIDMTRYSTVIQHKDKLEPLKCFIFTASVTCHSLCDIEGIDMIFLKHVHLTARKRKC